MDASMLLTIQIKAKRLPSPQYEYRFHKSRRWKFDLAWPYVWQVETTRPKCVGIAVEIEGGMYGVGPPCRSCSRRRVAGHSSIERLLKDLEKYNAAVELGWKIFRFTPQMIESGEAIKQIQRMLQ